MASKPQIFHADEQSAGQRLDQFLVAQIGDVSRARVQQLIDAGKVLVNRKAVKSSYRMEEEDEVEITGMVQPPPLKAKPENIPLDVVYEDDSLAVINKPAGMMVHAGAGQTAEDEEEADPRTSGTLVNALLHRFKKLSKEGGDLRPGIVHRLDKDTSGLIIVAKSDSAHRKLADAFATRAVKKTYLALVHGWPKTQTGTINAAIGRDRTHRSRMSTKSPQGRDALSHYKVLKEFFTAYGKFALLEVKIETGRTHQIRVHLSSIGHPVVGDTLYGAPRTIEPIDKAFFRAKPANTYATRDRAATDLARQLTEEAMAGKSAKKKSAKKATSAPPLNPKPISLERNFLHATAVEFTHPKTGELMTFSRPIPSELEQFLSGLPHLNQ